MKARIKFSKSGAMKYVGHLDIMRYFQKVIRRSGIPIKYSEGFNPHQIMSFAAPLGVGLTSSGEYMDIELTEEVPCKELLQAISNEMVDEMDIESVKYLPEKATNAMASVEASTYTLTYKHPEDFPFSLDELKEKKVAFYDDATSINVVKKTKKGEREVDLKPLIYKFDIVSGENVADFDDTLETRPEIVFEINISTGSNDNIKPELALYHFFKSFGIETQERASFFIHRVDMLTRDADGNLISLDDVGYEL